ncbi:MAG: FadR/GntR family transcriptional regulator [Thermodesulfobacteriota bacterium]
MASAFKHVFEPVRSGRTFEAIAEQIRESIYAGKLTPGDKLPTERELAKIFNTSRVSVRSALLNLEQAGFLDIRQGAGGGFFIKELNVKLFTENLHAMLRVGKATISDITEARSIIEPQAARLAAERATDEDLAGMAEAIYGFQDRGSQEGPPSPQDFSFHVRLAEATKNPAIIIISQSLVSILFKSWAEYYMSSTLNREINRQHQDILEAVRQKDGSLAQRLMAQHVANMRDMFLRYEQEK